MGFSLAQTLAKFVMMWSTIRYALITKIQTEISTSSQSISDSIKK